MVVKDKSGDLSVVEAAEILKVSARRVRAFCRSGRLGHRVGIRTYVIPRAECLEFSRKERPVGNPDFLTAKNPRKKIKKK